MQVHGIIDSMNISSPHLEDYFSNHDYNIETVKSIGVFEPHRWREEFKKSLTRNIVEAKILHTSLGLVLPIKRHSRGQHMQVIEFAGLHGYNDRSQLLSELLNSLLEHIHNEFVVRVDVAIDFKGRIPNKVVKELCKGRNPFRWKNTTYYKTKKEKSKNTTLDIKTYRKDKTKNDLNDKVERLEFCFKGQYLKNITVGNIESTFKKMEKTIKKFSGLSVQIFFL